VIELRWMKLHSARPDEPEVLQYRQKIVVGPATAGFAVSPMMDSVYMGPWTTVPLAFVDTPQSTDSQPNSNRHYTD
jgi:hypothetical protein